jgi:hypothetical protein
MASSLNNLGSASLFQDDPGQALKYWQESLSLLKEIGSKQIVEEILLGLAKLALHFKQQTQAAKLLGAAEMLHEIVETSLSSEMQAEHTACMAELHANLDETTINLAWAEGRSLSVEQIIDYGLSIKYDESSEFKSLTFLENCQGLVSKHIFFFGTDLIRDIVGEPY